MPEAFQFGAILSCALFAGAALYVTLVLMGIDRKSRDTHRLLVRWGRLHAVRTTASLSATIVFLIAVLKT